jgi:hypothetical protein
VFLFWLNFIDHWCIISLFIKVQCIGTYKNKNSERIAKATWCPHIGQGYNGISEDLGIHVPEDLMKRKFKHTWISTKRTFTSHIKVTAYIIDLGFSIWFYCKVKSWMNTWISNIIWLVFLMFNIGDERWTFVLLIFKCV